MEAFNYIIGLLEKHPIPFALFAFGFVLESMLKKERGEEDEIC